MSSYQKNKETVSCCKLLQLYIQIKIQQKQVSVETCEEEVGTSAEEVGRSEQREGDEVDGCTPVVQKSRKKEIWNASISYVQIFIQKLAAF